MIVEQARREDVPALCQLLCTLFAQEVEFRPDSAAQRDGLLRIIGHEALGAVLVARREGRIVGMVSLLFTVSTALGGRVALLEDMVVYPAERGVGVGSRLLREALGLARERGCRRITLLTDGSNDLAKAFYAKHGFAVSGMVPMRLLLD